MNAPEPASTYEQIIDKLLAQFSSSSFGLLPRSSIDWDEFVKISDRIHNHFQVPTTTITPIMRRMLHAIGKSCMPQRVIGLGTYTGYPVSWLVAHNQPVSITCVEPDRDSQLIAANNFAAFGDIIHSEHIHNTAENAISGLIQREEKYDMLFIDIDDDSQRKAGYLDALRSYMPLLKPGGWVIAHDTTAKKFETDMSPFLAFLEDRQFMKQSVTLPLDACGISIAKLYE